MRKFIIASIFIIPLWLPWSVTERVAGAADPAPPPSGVPGPPNTQVYAGPHAQFLKALRPLPQIKLRPQPPLVGPEEVEAGPLLVSLEDIGGVTVLAEDGKVRIAHAGDALEMGDSFQTGEKGNARVAFEKGVHVLMPPGAIVHLSQESIAGPAGGLDVPMVEVMGGEVRILVEGGPKPDSDDERIPRPLKLLVRSKAVVMGVRGTDFLVTVNEDHTDLRMISGTVELAADSHAIGMGHSVKAGPSEMAELVAGRPLPRPEHYEAGMELREFHERHPRLEEMWNTTVRDAKTQRLHAQFLEIRTRKVDVVNLKNGYPSTAIRLEGQRLDDEAKKWQLREQGKQDEKGLNTRSKRNRRRRKKAVSPAEPPAEPAAK